MKLAARFLISLCLLIGLPAHAAFWTDLWYVPSESGWGLNLIQQNTVVFATLFVYGASGQPSWYVASNVSDPSGTGTLSGALYQTTGPYFGGGSFDSSAVKAQQVGTITIRATALNTADVTYSVNGLTVQKSVFRQTWSSPDLTGVYSGTLRSRWSSCTAPLTAGSLNDVIGVTITDSPTLTSVQMRYASTSNVCSFSGQKTPFGAQFYIQGNLLCMNGATGTIALRGEYDGVAIVGQYQSSYGCSETGYIAVLNNALPP